MTIIDMLDALEAGIIKLHSGNGTPRTPAAPEDGPARGAFLRTQMENSGVTAAEFARIYGIDPAVYECWLRGTEAMPGWVPAALKVLAAIPPSARRRLRNGSQAANPPKHPFSRIEDL